MPIHANYDDAAEAVIPDAAPSKGYLQDQADRQQIRNMLQMVRMAAVIAPETVTVMMIKHVDGTPAYILGIEQPTIPGLSKEGPYFSPIAEVLPGGLDPARFVMPDGTVKYTAEQMALLGREPQGEA